MYPVRLLLIVLIFVSFHLRGQDTIPIFFESGISKVPDSELTMLKAILTSFALGDLDSMHYIGIADSVGDFNSNMKLSEKRARNVANYCAKLFPGKIKVKITALGEKENQTAEKNRRVDVIMYFHPLKVAEDKDSVPQTNTPVAKEQCYTIDYDLLHRCYIRSALRGKYVKILETTSPNAKKKQYYYGAVAKNGVFYTKKVTWATSTTGYKWWRTKRFVAMIPGDNFDDFKIFTVTDQPCSACNEDFPHNKKITKEDSSLYVDYFLKDNLQFKRIFRNKHEVRIRIPREYIDLDVHYFAGCDTLNKVNWDKKKPWQQKYYFYAKFPRYGYYVPSITRIMDYCKENPLPSECNEQMISIDSLQDPPRGPIISVEAGMHYQQSTPIAYAGIEISKDIIKNRFTILAGSDSELGFYGTLRYQYQYTTFLLPSFNSFSTWKKRIVSRNVKRYGQLYVGSELKLRLNNASWQDYLEQNIHTGVEFISTQYSSFIQRFFIQYGLGYNYLGNKGFKGLYSIAHLGVNIKIARLMK